jgi:transposase
LLADKAYSSRAHRALLRDRGITAVIPERADQQGHRLRRGSAGGRPVSYDTERYKDRNVVGQSHEKFEQWRGLATRYDCSPSSSAAALSCAASSCGSAAP